MMKTLALVMTLGMMISTVALAGESIKLRDERTGAEYDQTFKSHLATTRELTALLDSAKDEATAKEAAPKALELVKKWEAEAKALSALWPARAIARRNCTHR